MKALLATSGGVMLALLSSWSVALEQAGPARLPKWAERLGWTLVHSAWQLAAVAVVVAVVDLALKRRSANVRYAVGVAALMMMVVLPCVTWTQVVIEHRVSSGQRSSDEASAVGWDQRRFAAPAHHERGETDNGGPAPEAGWSHPTGERATVDPSLRRRDGLDDANGDGVGGVPSAERRDYGRVAGVGASSRNPGAHFANPQSIPGHPIGWSRLVEQMREVVEPRLPLFVVMWFVGVIVCSLRPVWGLRTQWRLRRVGLSPVSDELQRTLNDLTRRIGLRRVVRIAQSACVTVPMVVGYLRPMILLPASVLTGLTPTQLESLLAHELAHVRRHDWLVNALQVVVETLLFYHPAVWWLSSRIRDERELCCDDIALKVIGDKATYGRMLLALEELRHARPAGTLVVPTSLAATGGSLVVRIRRLMPSQQETQRASRGWLSGTVALAMLALSCGVWFVTQATAENGELAKHDVAVAEQEESKNDEAADDKLVASRPVGDPAEQEKNVEPNLNAEAPHPQPLSPQSRGEGSKSKPPAKFDATGEILRHVATRKVGLKDWPEWCGSPHRNNTPSGEDIPTKWDIKTGENVLWKVEHRRGNMTTPVIANGRVYVAGNNQSGAVPRHPKTQDLGCLRAHDTATGEFLWQATHPKLARGKDGAFRDWPMIGVCSPPTVEGERLWYVSNRGDVVCLDTEGFRDGENDGPIVDEVEHDLTDADFIWQVDLVKDFGIEPHLVSASAILCVGDRLFVITSNGVDASHMKIPNPNAPSFVCLDKHTGKVLWTDNSPGGNILAGCWSSPCAFEINGETQIVMPGGDGWLYSFTPVGDGQGQAKLLWKFDANPKESKFTLATGRSERNSILATPVFYDGLVYVGVGANPEHGEGSGRLWCLDPNKRGDVSSELAVDAKDQPLPPRRVQAVVKENGERAVLNPNSAVVWCYTEGVRGKVGQLAVEQTMHRTLGNVAIKNDLLFISDFAGVLHCLDAKPTAPGKTVVHWTHDLFAAAWGTPLIVEDKVYIGDEDGDVAIFALSKTKQLIAELNCDHSIQTTPVVANDTLFINTVNQLIALKQGVMNGKLSKDVGTPLGE